MSQFIHTVHTCVLPTDTTGKGQGTIWQCDCGQMYELRWTGYSYGTHTTGSAGWGWSYFDKRFWNEAEQRPLTRDEQSDIWLAEAEKHRALFPDVSDRGWRKMWKKATEWKFGDNE